MNRCTRILWSVTWRIEAIGHHVRVLGLGEPGFEVFLGAVGVDDLVERSVVVVGDQDRLPKISASRVVCAF